MKRFTKQMQNKNLAKGLSTAAVALALVTGLSVPVNATQADSMVTQQEMSQLGLTVGAPAISLKEQRASGQVTTAWTFNYSPVPAPLKDATGSTIGSYKMYVVVFDQGDRTKPVYGSYHIDDLGKYVYCDRDGDGGYTYKDPVIYSGYDYEFTIGSSSLTPGKKEVVAYMFDEPAYEMAYDAAYDAAKANYNNTYNAWVAAGSQGDVPEAPDYSAKGLGISKADYFIASAPITIEVQREASASTIVTANSIQLEMSSADATGYEIYRKIGKKYIQIAKVSADTYTDNGLESNKAYSYKIRPYYIDKDTKATTYGKYTLVEATTKGSALNAKALVNKKNKVELSWNKVNGAVKYEIYRVETSSDASSYTKDDYNSFSSYKLMTTVKKSKKKWTDKKVSANDSYNYCIRAILADKSCVEQYVGASIRFSAPQIVDSYVDASGNKTVEWDRVNGASGYIVEKKVTTWTKDTDGDWNSDENWIEYARLGKNKTKVKLPAGYEYNGEGKIADNEIEYRIKAYKGTNTYSSTVSINTAVAFGTVSKVSAKEAAHGIQVSWSAVPGAAYYRVYRVRKRALVKNNNIKAYDNVEGELVTEYVGVTEPRAVDVTSWNTTVDASIAAYNAAYKAWQDGGRQGDAPDRTLYLDKSDKLNANLSYCYQNYSYARSVFDANTTSIMDYSGKVYSGSDARKVKKAVRGNDGKAVVTEWQYEYDPVVTADSYAEVGPDEGVEYQYYVVAYTGTAKTELDYIDYSGDGSYFDQDAYDAAWDVYYAADKAYDDAWSAYYSAKYAYEDYLDALEDYERDYDYYLQEKEEYENGDSYYAPTEPTKPVEVAKPVEPTMESPKYPSASLYYYSYGANYYYAKNTTTLAYNTASVGGPAATDMVTGVVTVLEANDYKDSFAHTIGVKKVGEASYSSVAVPTKKVTIKSLKAGKKSATVKIKKKVKGAAGYKIYRATKKKGKYISVGTTKKTSFKDTGLTAGKKYYYKVVPYVQSESGAQIEGKASAVKSVKAK